jgi:hypothetical protein
MLLDRVNRLIEDVMKNAPASGLMILDGPATRAATMEYLARSPACS